MLPDATAPEAVHIDAPTVSMEASPELPTDTATIESQDRGQMGVEGFAPYLLNPQSEWTESDWSQQLFNDTAHHWADFGFS